MHKQLVLTANMFMIPTSIYQKIDFLAFPCYLPLEGYLLPSLLGIERVPGDKSQSMPMMIRLTGHWTNSIGHSIIQHTIYQKWS